MYLNGVAIMSNDNTAWSPANPTNYFVGCAYNTTTRFSGKCLSLQVFSLALTPIQAADLHLRMIKQVNDI